MKLEMSMKEMQELMNRKGQLEIMGKSYTLNPQDELLIKFIMDYKEKRPLDYYDIISGLFNTLLSQGQYCQPAIYQPQMWANGCYPTMQPQFINQAPQMSYEDMKNMYKKQFASQLGLDIDGDEEEHPCDCCHTCDGNCEENIASQTTEEEKEIAKDMVNKVEKEYKERLFSKDKNGISEDDFKTIKSFLDKDGNFKEDKWCRECIIMGIKCDDNCDKHHADYEKMKSNNGDINDKLDKLEALSVYGSEPRRLTGKQDKNGINIYEGDILKCKLLPSGKYENYLVEWNFEDACYEALNHDESNFILPSAWNETEVIGNITDNPELMKPKDDDK